MIRIQLGAITEDLVGKAVQVLDVVGEPRHWRIMILIIYDDFISNFLEINVDFFF